VDAGATNFVLSDGSPSSLSAIGCVRSRPGWVWWGGGSSVQGRACGAVGTGAGSRSGRAKGPDHWKFPGASARAAWDNAPWPPKRLVAPKG
jgi:hypothetical protein